ncbi:MAG: putative metal-binding motif-containing protein, partial [Myxococcota bacterium]
MKVRTRWFHVLAACLLLSIASSCSFDSSLGDVTCTEEGARDGDRVCQDGYWTAADDVVSDATDTPGDGEADGLDVTPDLEDTGPDAPTCTDGEELCGDECVDTDTSAEHCGGCDLECIAYGSNSVAECGNGTCSRYCEAGFSDDNDDWLTDNPDAGSDGCESSCTPTQPPTEVCDGVDNDCDGRIDNAENKWYRDADGDGYGADDSGIIQCDRPSDAYVDQGGDCNDSDPAINPGVVEECQGDSCELCNGIDDNCNGRVDEDCPCTGDETQTCFPFGSGSPGNGNCAEGEQQCSEGTFGDCTGAVGPETEVCDDFDNDCDGNTDEGFSDKGTSCTVGTGACENSGTYECSGDGSGVTCSVSAGSPSSESCDDIDNDCDGQTDEDFPNKGNTCTAGTGACENSGTVVCNSSNDGTTCSASAGSPSSESCDGIDNDCDGQTDEDFPNKGNTCTAGT